MFFNDEIYKQDIKYIISSTNFNWNEFKQKTFLITGATGLIGALITNALINANVQYNLNLKIVVWVHNQRNIEKIIDLEKAKNNIKIISGDIRKKVNLKYKIDYIIHAASQTSSKMFITDPLETIDISIDGTKNILEIARKQ